jgi:hypothetical protein
VQFEYKKYVNTGDLSAAFVGNFNFHWPYPDDQIFAFDPVTQQYCLSATFVQYAYNYQNWTMRPDFFKAFPEMIHDIPCFQGPPDMIG